MYKLVISEFSELFLLISNNLSQLNTESSCTWNLCDSFYFYQFFFIVIVTNCTKHLSNIVYDDICYQMFVHLVHPEVLDMYKVIHLFWFRGHPSIWELFRKCQWPLEESFIFGNRPVGWFVKVRHPRCFKLTRLHARHFRWQQHSFDYIRFTGG